MLLWLKALFSKDNFKHLSTWSGLALTTFVLIDIFLFIKPTTGIIILDIIITVSSWFIGCYLIYWGVPEIMRVKKVRASDKADRSPRSPKDHNNNE